MPERPWLKLERFDCSPLAGRWSVVRMLAALENDLRPPGAPRLIIQRGPASSSHGAFVSAADRRTTGAATELLWIASFAVPLEIVEYEGALFELAAAGRPAIALPAPGTLVLPSRTSDLPERRWLPAHARRRVGALATAVAVSTASIPASGLAAARTAHGFVKHPLDGRDLAATAARLGRHPVHVKLGSAVHVVALGSHPLVRDAHAHKRHAKTWGASARRSATPVDPGVPAPTAPTTTAPTHPVTIAPASTGQAAGWSTGVAGTGSADGPQGTRKTKRRRLHLDEHHIVRRHRPSGGAAVAPPLNAVHQLQPVPSSVSEETSEPAGVETGAPFGGAGSSGSGLTGTPPASLLARMFADTQGPPPFLISIYKRAGHRYQVPWPVLAAINSIETDYGRNLSVSSAGAEGWMQFMPGTWREYRVDANHDGKTNPYDPTDAIFAAARYLHANGAPRDLRRAIFAYNHATWYVDEVMLRSRWIAANSQLKVKGPAGRKISAMTAMAELLIGRPYIWGGGHGGWGIVAGYDCSGFVSAVLHAGGYLSSPQTTDTMPSQPDIKPGPGRYVTIFDRTGGQGHVIIDLNGTFYESGGSAAGGGGAGVKKIGQPPFDYLLSFTTILHPAGL